MRVQDKLVTLSKKDKAILKGMRDAMNKNTYGWINISDTGRSSESDFVVHPKST